MDLKQYDKTPVEWLYLELFYFLNGQSEFEDSEKILERAKEMEKEHIKNAHIDGQPLYSCQSEKAEQYYNETYKGNK
jgi:HrpA-like RNA helicase